MARKDLSTYIESRKGAWSPSTIKTAHSKLRALVFKGIDQLEPEAAYAALIAEGKSPYTIKTLFTLMHGFELYRSNSKKWAAYMDSHARLFKNVYVKERINVTFDEAYRLISHANFSSDAIKQAALLMLTAGLRSTEALAYEGSGTVIGKGGSVRPVFTNLNIEQSANQTINYRELYSELKIKTGLKPHTLRKLAATRLAQSGFTLQDIMEVMGWRTIQTAASYLQPLANEKLKARVGESLGQRQHEEAARATAAATNYQHRDSSSLPRARATASSF